MPAAVSPVKSVSGRAWASQVNESAPALAGGVSASAPPGERYQAAAVVPGIGKLGKDCSKPGGQGAARRWPAGAVVEQDADRLQASKAASAPA